MNIRGWQIDSKNGVDSESKFAMIGNLTEYCGEETKWF